MIIVIFDETQRWLGTLKWQLDRSVEGEYSSFGTILLKPVVEDWKALGVSQLTEQHVQTGGAVRHELGTRRVPLSADNASSVVRAWLSTHQMIGIELPDQAEKSLNQILGLDLAAAEKFLLVQALFHTPPELQGEWEKLSD